MIASHGMKSEMMRVSGIGLRGNGHGRKKQSVFSKTMVYMTLFAVLSTTVFCYFLWNLLSREYTGRVRDVAQSLFDLRCKELEDEMISPVLLEAWDMIVGAKKDLVFSYFMAREMDHYAKIYALSRTIQSSVAAKSSVISTISLYTEGLNLFLSSESGLSLPTDRNASNTVYRMIFGRHVASCDSSWWDTDSSGMISYNIMYPQGVDSKYALGYISIGINGHLLDKLVSRWNTDSQAGYLVYDQLGKPLLFHAPPEVQRKLGSRLPAEQNYLHSDGLEAYSFVLSNGWRVHQVAVRDNIYRSLYLLGASIAGVYGVLLFCWMGSAKVSQIMFRKPLKHIIDEIRDDFTLENEEVQDEYEFIGNRIKALHSEVYNQDSLLRENQQVLQRNFLITVIFSERNSHKHLCSFARICEISLPYSAYCVILVKLPAYQDVLEKPSKGSVMQHAGSNFVFYATRISQSEEDRYLFCLYNCGANEASQAGEGALSALEAILGVNRACLFYTMGRFSSSLADMHHSQLDAYQAIRYAYFVNDQRLLNDPGFIERCERSAACVKKSCLARFSASLKERDTANAVEALQVLEREIVNNPYAYQTVLDVAAYISTALFLHIMEVVDDVATANAVNALLGSASCFTDLVQTLCVELECLKANYYEPGTQPDLPDSAQHKRLLVSRAQDFISKNIQSDLSMVTVSEYLGISGAYLSKIFKEVSGQNFVHYVIEQKLERAKSLLDENRDLTVEQVACQVCYNNTSYFIRRFREQYNMTPKAYRESLQEQT